MLTLNDGRSELWQWDTGRTLAVDADCSQVHFSNKIFGRSIDVDVVDCVAIIPDILLQTDKDLIAWAFVGTAENGYTKISKVFKVNKRNKPSDYVFTPTDQTTLDDILDRIEDLEKRPSGGNGGIEKEVDPTVPDWAKQSEKPKYTADEVGALSHGELQEGINLALEQAKNSGVFDGDPGKSAYQYAQDGGYTGTEEEFAQKLAADGVGDGTMMRELFRISMEEDAVLRVKTTADGIPFQDLKLDKVKIVLRAPKTESNVSMYLQVIIGGTDFIVANYDIIYNNQNPTIHVINCDRFADKTWELTRRRSRMHPAATIRHESTQEVGVFENVEGEFSEFYTNPKLIAGTEVIIYGA